MAHNERSSLYDAACRCFGGRDLNSAVDLCHQLLSQDPTDARAMNLLGAVHGQAGRNDEAEKWFRAATVAEPSWAEAHNNLGLVIGNQKRFDEAIACYRRALELRPDYQNARDNLDAALFRVARAEEVRETPVAFVRGLFNAYAEKFESHLVGTLQYRGPELLLAAVTAVCSRKNFSALDIGCGTGLCGVRFRPICTRLVGVDVASAMIAESARKQVYDELLADDYREVLDRRRQEFDLVIAGDVFIYVGDLLSTFSIAADSLRPGSIFAFTVESYEGPAFVRRESLRFAHSLTYLRDLAQRFGFRELLAQDKSIRSHNDEAIPSLVVVLQKAPASAFVQQSASSR